MMDAPRPRDTNMAAERPNRRAHAERVHELPMLYFTVLRTSISERLTYRADFALGTLMRFLPIVTQIFLWQAVFAGMSGGRGSVAGYTMNQMVAYYLLTMVGRAFSSMPGLAGGIAKDIRDGTVKKYLL